MIQRVALCVVCLSFVAETSAMPTAVSQTREIHPQIERQQVYTMYPDNTQGGFLQADSWVPHVVLYSPLGSQYQGHTLANNNHGTNHQALNATNNAARGSTLPDSSGQNLHSWYRQGTQDVIGDSPTTNGFLSISGGPLKVTTQQRAQSTQSAVQSRQAAVQSIKSKAKRRLSGRSGSVQATQSSSGNWMSMTATWYDAHEGINGTGDGITASGAPVQAGLTIAVDPKVIPLGSIVQVKFPNGTSHLYKAEDVGGAIKGHRIDIYDPSPQDCYRHGIQHVVVRIWHVKSIQDVRALLKASGQGGAAA